jgi:hypothetical protein
MTKSNNHVKRKMENILNMIKQLSNKFVLSKTLQKFRFQINNLNSMLVIWLCMKIPFPYTDEEGAEQYGPITRHDDFYNLVGYCSKAHRFEEKKNKALYDLIDAIDEYFVNDPFMKVLDAYIEKFNDFDENFVKSFLSGLMSIWTDPTNREFDESEIKHQTVLLAFLENAKHEGDACGLEIDWKEIAESYTEDKAPASTFLAVLIGEYWHFDSVFVNEKFQKSNGDIADRIAIDSSKLKHVYTSAPNTGNVTVTQFKKYCPTLSSL